MNSVPLRQRLEPLRTAGYRAVAWPVAVLFYLVYVALVGWGVMMLMFEKKKKAPPP